MPVPGRVTGPNTRNDPPVADDWGEVVRPVGPIGPVIIEQPSTSTVTPVDQSIVVVTLQLENTKRRGLIIYNDSPQNLYIKTGAAAGLSDFTLRMCPGATYEFPFPVTTELITGIWAFAGDGFARVTEMAIP